MEPDHGHPDRRRRVRSRAVRALPAFTYQRREAVRSIIERGVESGELRAGIDTDLAAQLVGGTLFYQRLMLRRAADDHQLERIVDLVLDGLRA